MKIALVVLILYFSISLTTAFGWFDFGAKKTTVLSNTQRPVSHPQRSGLRKQNQPRRHQYNFRNTTVAHRQADSINRKAQQNRSREIAHHPATFRQANRIIHSRFGSLFLRGKNNSTGRRSFSQDSFSKPNNPPQSTLGKVNVKNTKTSLLRLLTTKITNSNGIRNQHRVLSNTNYRFYPYKNEKNLARTHTNKNSTLTHRNRRIAPDVQSEPSNSMVFVRSAADDD